MDFIKMNGQLFFSTLMVISIVSCSDSSTTEANYVAKEKYEAKIEEYKQLNSKQAAIIEDNIEKNKVINNVLSELRQLTGATTNLRHDIESGGGRVNQAQEIQERLDVLKQTLSGIRQSAKKDDNTDSNLLATVANLQQIIVQKEEEIAQLQQQIIEKDETIRTQQNTINLQQLQLLKKQQESWYQLGESLHDVVKELPKVKGRKDKRNVKNARLYILNKSLECFQQAHQLGHAKAQNMCTKIEREIEEL